MKFGLLLWMLLSVFVNGYSQNDSIQSEPDYIVIAEITLLGNHITQDDIIFREMSVHKGDTILRADLNKRLEVDRTNIFNTALFNTVKIDLIETNSNSVVLVVSLKERWYIFPAPILELVDRNFNDWWVNHNHSFARVNYGAFLYQKNVRGRNETLRLLVQGGYTKRLGLNYSMPFLDKKKKNGLEVQFLYSSNNNAAFQTVAHKREFADDNEPLLKRLEAGIIYTFRNSFDAYHYLELNYEDYKINQVISDLNPEYFLNGDIRQQQFSLSYSFRYDKRDLIAYPKNGYVVDFSFKKSGLGVFNDLNHSALYLRASKYLSLPGRFYLDNHTALYKINNAGNVPYNRYSGLGYSPFLVRGNELYTIEGRAFALNKTSFKKSIFKREYEFDWMSYTQFQHFPIEILLKSYFDVGYVQNFDGYDANTLFTNRLIYGYGLGLDFVLTYDVVLRLEYSINDINERGFFYHLKKEF